MTTTDLHEIWPEDPPEQADDLPTTGVGSPATTANRAIARAVDALVGVGPALFLPVLLGSENADGDLDPNAAAAVAGLVWWYLYEAVLVGWRGQTLGKILTRIAVLDRRTGRPPTYFKAGMRVLVVIAVTFLVALLVAVPLIGLVFVYGSAVAGGPLRRGLPDRAADTVVVNLYE